MRPRALCLAVAILAALAGVAVPAAAQEGAAGATALDSLLETASRSRVKGSADAPVTIVELSDFQCPYCREFTETVYRGLDSAYVRTGRAQLVFLNLPLPGHPRAWVAAEAAMCAGAQDAFWPMHDRLFAEQAAWSDAASPGALFEEYADGLGLDLTAFRACAADDLMAPLLLGDVIQAARSGASATPTFILNGRKVLSGVRPLSDFQAAIEELLAGDPGR